MRKALVVGLNYYKDINSLNGCINDAYNLKAVLERNSDGTLNFDVKLLTAESSEKQLERGLLKDEVENLFRGDADVSLFYFAGHGYIEEIGGYLVTSECRRGDDGLSINDILQLANDSPARNKIIILDCCHSGMAGEYKSLGNVSLIKNGVTILTASSADQYAEEKNGSGVFTDLLIDALNGGAANLLGDITPGSVYAHIDQSLGPWEQRPIFKTNVKTFTTLRQVQPSITLDDLKRITELFPNLGKEFELTPEYEPECESAIREKVEVFKILQKYNRVNLVVPVGADHMYFAAMNSKACKLTILGEHYWKLVKKKRI